jgi:hypothetical protein
MEWNGKGKEEKGMVIPKHLARRSMFYVIQSIGICTALFMYKSTSDKSVPNLYEAYDPGRDI